jgi:hypothetical protein|tara:strand:+ start:1400 stop:2644 length:1245 start_codon:yes stop_codon:yes gene_type:complete
MRNMKNLVGAVLLQPLFTFYFAVCICFVCMSSKLQASDAKLELIASPAPLNSSLSRVVTDSTGRVYLSWVTQKEAMATLFYSTLVNGAWSAPEIISQGTDWFNNWADFPSLMVNKDSMAAHWLRMSAAGTYDYDVQAAFYNLDTNDWSEGITIHKDGISAEHGFVSMLPMSEGQTFISWLDGRETIRGGNEETGSMTLRAGIFNKAGETVSEWELDHRVCDCCQTSAAMSSTGPLVVYRDRSEKEIRDIYFTRYVNGKWTEPTAIHNDGWEIAGCPVNGPSVAANGNQVAVSWFTAKDDAPMVKLAISNDGGETFSAPTLVAEQNTNGRVGTTILESGNIAVSWMDTEEPRAKIMLTLYNAEAKLLENTQIATSSASRRSGFPVIVSAGNDVYVTWTQIGSAMQVRVARVIYSD